ncbi:MAG TPA: alpha/beta fold hydrolase [Actinomycetota bacterium]|nr:alpha/beta fold hydrolase [Actinomycetota bacterium]
MSEQPLWERRFRAPTRTLPAWGPAAPDRFVLLSDEQGSFQAYAWEPGSDPVRRTDEPVGVSLAMASADGSSVVWFSDPTGDESGRWLAVPFGGGDPVEVFPGAPVGWPEGLSLGRELAVAVLADRDGFAVYVSEDGGAAKEIHRHPDVIGISDSELHLEGFDRVGLSADETLVCLEVAQDGDNIRRKLLVLDPRTGAVVGELADGPGLGVRAFGWSPVPGDQRILIGHERQDLLRPSVWDPTTGERTDIPLDLPGDGVPIDWWPGAGSILIAHLFRGRDRLYRLDLESGSLTEIGHPVGEILGARVRPDGRVWLRLSRGHRASVLLDDTGAEVLARAAGGVREGRPYREWLFRNTPGDVVHGWLATPPGDGPFPLFLKVHGGPDWLYLDTWFPDVQSLVDEGFAVAMVNYRGSIGFGRRWRDHIIGNIGFPEVEDVVAGRDDLVARGIADPERVVIGGWSWGGYITLLALGLHPDRFAAGVAGVPVGDYLDSYDDSAPSLQAYDRTLAGGVVHDIPEFIAERSPITYVKDVKAPVFVLVGERDSRCVPGQVYRYVRALRRAGGEVELYSYPEGHSSYLVDEEVREWGAVLEFLRRRVRLP